MNKSQKKVLYSKASKRNPMVDVSTDAGRRAKNREFDQDAEQRLRAALKNPTDTKGRPVAGHLLKTIAAERLSTIDISNPASVFDYASMIFLRKLKYCWGCAPSISSLWQTFLETVEAAEANIARVFAQNYAVAFRWCLIGHVHRLNDEYTKLPKAVIKVEIWKTKNGFCSVGVQRDGRRCIIPSDSPPVSPITIFAGTKINHFVAPKDLERIKRMGAKRFSEECQAGKFKFSPRPTALMTEDTLLNVGIPDRAELENTTREIGWITASLQYKPTGKTTVRP